MLKENLAYAAQRQIQGRQYAGEKISAGHAMVVFNFNRLNVLPPCAPRNGNQGDGISRVAHDRPELGAPAGVNATSLAGIPAHYRAQTTRSKYTGAFAQRANRWSDSVLR